MHSEPPGTSTGFLTEQNPAQKLIVASCNIEGVKGNAPYLQDLMKISDIICIQEHWLWDFEKVDIEKFLGEWDYFIRCVDLLYPAAKFERGRGYGGTAIIWNKQIQPSVKTLDDGSERILALEINCKPHPLCIINVYKPTAGYSDSTSQYKASLDLLDVIISKYRDTHSVLISGDLNATLLDDRNLSQDKLLKALVKENELSVHSTGSHMTYQHGSGKSQIDYFLCTNHALIANFMLLDDVCSNTSTHTGIKCDILLDNNLKISKEVKVKRFRSQWDTCDTHRYKKCISDSVETPVIITPSDIDREVKHIHDVCLAAERASVPKKLVKLHGPKWKSSPKIRQILSDRKRVYRQWITVGRPGPEHPLSIIKTNLKYDLRREQRKERASERIGFYEEVMAQQNSANFYRLINRNNKSSRSTVALLEKGHHVTKSDEQCRSFAAFYEDLAIPSDNSEFDSDYQNRLAYDLDLIRKIVSDTDDVLPIITPVEFACAIKMLHNKKAKDEFGIVSEHIKTAGEAILQPIASIFTSIMHLKHVPSDFKSGILHPIHKKGKDPANVTNYRGITVTSILGKIFEHVILKQIEESLPLNQSTLQFGFTKGISPLMAALIVSETISEYVENNRPIYMSFLDSQKAFDVVAHTSMKCKLFHQGINQHIWNVIDNLYTSLSSKVLWKGNVSSKFSILQGVRQGGILSTGLYKTYINDLLLELHGSNGLQPSTSYRIYSLYVLPKLLYGLETFVLLRKHIDALETYHLSALRIIQSLPQRCAKCAVYLLLGARPIEAELQSRTLTFLGNIIRSNNPTLLNILTRQLSVKSHSSKSWVVYVRDILLRYNLQGIEDLLVNIPSRDSWKASVSDAINTYWNKKLKEECSTKSTLLYLHRDALCIGSIHPLWFTVDSNIRDTRRAITKARFLTGTYMVQSKLSRFNQNTVDPTCQLCQSSVENYQHVLLECGALLTYRKEYLCELSRVMTYHFGKGMWENLSKDVIMDIIMDVTRANVVHSMQLNTEQCTYIERISRYLCYRVHSGSIFLLEKVSRGKRGPSGS
ncbi:hypothetical protein FSP39_002699 [Pinctada imbricata]|uniref:Reverse transcriptase domain-containing protein n=1 Tax=Pinctada imbricata TaxID=66713 RepID=A0AA89CCG4_PINIB|nr:hypothetical protein FSP39_002699 [Pinctada imbricata]